MTGEPGKTGSLSENLRRERMVRMREGMKKVDKYANSSGWGVSGPGKEERRIEIEAI